MAIWDFSLKDLVVHIPWCDFTFRIWWLPDSPSPCVAQASLNPMLQPQKQLSYTLCLCSPHSNAGASEAGHYLASGFAFSFRDTFTPL